MAAWLADQVRAAIADGRLPLGSRLPASRVLAAELAVSRGVVTEAYQRLTEDGHVVGRGRAGTIVVAPAFITSPTAAKTPRPPAPGSAPEPGPSGPDPSTEAGTSVSVSADEVRSTDAPSEAAGAPPSPPPGKDFRPADGAPRRLAAEPGIEVFDVMRAAPARVDLTPGVPDLAAFPRAAWMKAERTVLDGLSAAAFGYGDPAGTPALRVAVARWLARYRGIQADPQDVIVVAGVAQALGLIAQVLIAEGIGELAIEDPGSLGSRRHLASWGLCTPPIPVDADGLRVDVLRDSGARAVVLTPAHQFPTGVVLEGGRRRALIQWATEGGLILEDDYDAEHRYDRPPVPALRAMLPEQVIYAGSVSKLLAPALRLGWMLAPARYRDALVGAKRLADLGNAALPQLVVAQLMESGELERQLRFVRRRHRRRRDAMIAAISKHLPRATVHGAAAGLHLTITFDDHDVDDLELAAAALDHGVKTQPLSWHCQRPHSPGLVLGYAARTPTEITEAVATLGALLR